MGQIAVVAHLLGASRADLRNALEAALADLDLPGDFPEVFPGDQLGAGHSAASVFEALPGVPEGPLTVGEVHQEVWDRMHRKCLEE